MNDKPRIAFVGHHSCIRSQKQAIVLKELGYEITWVCNMPPPQTPWHFFDKIVLYGMGDNSKPVDKETNFDHFRATVKRVAKDVDVFIAYNEPNWFVTEIKKVTNKPVIWDLHDLTSERDFIVRPDEDSEFRLADAILTQGPGYHKVCCERRPDLAKKGLISWAYSGVPRALYPTLDMPLVAHGSTKFGGLVYEGGLASRIEGGSEFRYRWWQPFFEKLVNMNLQVTVHAASQGDYSQYAKAGVRVITMLPYMQMLQHLTLYDWGICGNAVHHPAFDKAWPNKLFEYLAAGLPIMVHDSKEVEQFVKDEGIGVVVKSPEDVKRVYASAPDFAPAVQKARIKFQMDNQIQPIIDLINKTIEVTK